MKISENIQNFFKSLLLTNLLFLILFILLSIISSFLEIKHTKGKLFTTKKITYLASFVAIISIINLITGWTTNLLFNYNFSVYLGEGIIMIPGMLFGPLSGIICGLCSDTIGTMVEGFFQYHFGFSFEIIFLGFMGGLVWIFANNKNWIIFTICFYLISQALSDFLITPICLVTLGFFPNYKFAYSLEIITATTIKFAMYTLLYLSVFFLFFRLSHQICSKSFSNLWCNKNIKEIYFYKWKI